MNQSTIIAMLAMLLFGVVYAATVRHVRNRHPDHGQTAWFVVVGVGAVIIAFGIVVGSDLAIVLLALFACAGGPMIIEYVDSHTDTLRRLRMAARIAQREDGPHGRL